MSELVAHAKRELALLRGDKPDEMQDMIDAHVIKMVELFSSEGHSGSSASYTLGILKKVLAFEPITPLTGADEEWFDHGDGMFQNKRCGNVFKNHTGAYDIDAIVFREPSGACFTSSDSHQPVTFPYTPTREYRDVEEQR